VPPAPWAKKRRARSRGCRLRPCRSRSESWLSDWTPFASWCPAGAGSASWQHRPEVGGPPWVRDPILASERGSTAREPNDDRPSARSGIRRAASRRRERPAHATERANQRLPGRGLERLNHAAERHSWMRPSFSSFFVFPSFSLLKEPPTPRQAQPGRAWLATCTRLCTSKICGGEGCRPPSSCAAGISRSCTNRWRCAGDSQMS